MITKNFRNVGLALVVTAGLFSCSDTGTKTSSSDSLNKDTSTAAPSITTTTDAPQAQSDDAKLVYELVESMYGGIALMKQGQTKATSPAVKALAKKLETEHTKLTDDLKTLAEKKGWTLPTGPSADDTKKMEDITKETGTDYDKDWLETLKDKHETNIGKLEDAKPADADLQAAGQKGLPKLKELLASIESVQKSVK